MKKYIYLFTLLFLAALMQAQNIPFDKKLFKERKDQFKVAKMNLDKGDDIFSVFSPAFMGINESDFLNRRTNYREAFPLLLKANEFNPNNAELNYKLGRCYLMNSVDKDKSISHFLKAQELNHTVAHDIQYHLGIGYHINMEFDKALIAFNRFKKSLVSENVNEHEDIDKRIKECEIAKILTANPKRVFIDNFGRPINSKYPEYGATISADESVMMFTSRRNTSTGAKQMMELDGDYDEDIYITTKENGNWTDPINMGSQINTEAHDATTAVSPDGQRMIIYKAPKGDGNLYECILTGSTWSKPVKMNKNINTKHHESSASYSSDGSVLYFVSNKPGGFGAHDIYITYWNQEKSEWGEAQNVGSPINTKYDEEAIFFHPDGKTLYFSSRGHETMGNYDVFKSTLQKDGKWGKPENMGYPINTVNDDVFFVINGSGRRGYYSSSSDDGHGDKDIYQITFLGDEKPFQLSSEDNLLASVTQPLKEKVVEKQVNTSSKRITILKGIISDCKTLLPVHASIELIDIDENKTLATFESNETTGKYLVSLPSGKNYGLIVRKDGYLFHSENFNISDSAAYEEVKKDICLKKIEVGSVIILKNIFYDYNKSSLRDASKNELDRLNKLLTENPTIKIELSAHTDSRGGDTYNQKLSHKRAETCVNYLIKGGIASERLVARGYGETKLIKTDEEIATFTFEENKEIAHQENRRTEFKIIEK